MKLWPAPEKMFTILLLLTLTFCGSLTLSEVPPVPVLACSFQPHAQTDPSAAKHTLCSDPKLNFCTVRSVNKKLSVIETISEKRKALNFKEMIIVTTIKFII